MTLLLSSMWRTFRPFSSIWLNFTSHRALYYASSVTCRDIRQNSVRASLSITVVIIPTIVFTSDRRTNFICLGRNISDTRHMCHPDLASVHHGAVVEKNRRNLAGKVAKHTVSVLPNILYPYCQTFLPQMWLNFSCRMFVLMGVIL